MGTWPHHLFIYCCGGFHSAVVVLRHCVHCDKTSIALKTKTIYYLVLYSKKVCQTLTLYHLLDNVS